MAKSAVIDTEAAKRIISQLEKIEQFKVQIIQLIPDSVLTYGSKLWWEKEVLAGEKEMKQRKYKIYKNAESLLNDLHRGI